MTMMEQRIELRARMVQAREALALTRRELGIAAGCSEGLVRILEEDWASVTHPNIAARILAELEIREPDQLRCLTAKRRWNRLPEIPARKGLARAKQEIIEVRQLVDPLPPIRVIREENGFVQVNWARLEQIIQKAGTNWSELSLNAGHSYDYLAGKKRAGGRMREEDAWEIARVLGTKVERVDVE